MILTDIILKSVVSGKKSEIAFGELAKARFLQTCALGSAMAASVVADIHPDISIAQKKMGGGFEKEYYPNPAHTKVYDVLYEKYKKLGGFVEEEYFDSRP